MPAPCWSWGRVNRILFDIAEWRVVPEGGVVVLHLVSNQRITGKQAYGLPDRSILGIVRRVHGFVDRVVQNDLEGVRLVGEEAEPGNAEAVGLRIGQQVDYVAYYLLSLSGPWLLGL
jgi:hypothetical protein